MVADVVAVGDDAPDEVWVLLPVLADDEEGGGHVLALEYVENARRPSRVGAVVERECDEAGPIARALDDVARRRLLVRLRRDYAVRRIEFVFAHAVVRLRRDV